MPIDWELVLCRDIQGVLRAHVGDDRLAPLSWFLEQDPGGQSTCAEFTPGYVKRHKKAGTIGVARETPTPSQFRQPGF